MISNNTLHQPQPHTGSHGPGRKKRISHPLQISLINACPAITHINAYLFRLDNHLYDQLTAILHRIYGIAEQMNKNPAHQVGVKITGQIVLRQEQFQFNTLLFHGRIKKHHRLAQQRAELNRFFFRRGILNKVKKIFQNMFNFDRFAGHHIQEFQPFRIICLTGKQSGGSADKGNGITDTVRKLSSHMTNR